MRCRPELAGGFPGVEGTMAMAALLLAAGRAHLLWCPRNRLPLQFLFERKGDSQSPGNQQEAQGTGRWPLWDFLGIRFTVLNFHQLAGSQ